MHFKCNLLALNKYYLYLQIFQNKNKINMHKRLHLILLPFRYVVKRIVLNNFPQKK